LPEKSYFTEIEGIAMEQKNSRILVYGILAAVAVFSLVWYFNPSGTVEVNRQTIGIMDTVVTVRVYAETKEQGDAAIDTVYSVMEGLEDELSRHVAGSPVDTINSKAGQEAVQVSPHVMYVIQGALETARQTGGAFDITVAPLLDLWAIGTVEARVPAPAEIEEKLGLIDYSQVQVQNGRVFLPREGMALDLGGVAKGYIVDQGIAALKEEGIQAAYLDAGGDIRVMGEKPDGTPWRIGIRHPRDRNKVLAVIPLTGDGAVVTSGDYQRYFEEGGIRYHHILDPVSGYPAQAGIISATVIAGDTMTADILSTAFFVLGVEKSLELVERLPGIDAVLITRDLEIHMSSGIKDSIEVKEVSV
jgi:FAD:protein FMN transferase